MLRERERVRVRVRVKERGREGERERGREGERYLRNALQRAGEAISPLDTPATSVMSLLLDVLANVSTVPVAREGISNCFVNFSMSALVLAASL